jgi:hypothetical protein
LDPEILLFRDAHQQPAGACVLVRRTVRRGPVSIRRVFINTAGADEGDDPVIEFNNLLCAQGQEDALCATLRWYIEKEAWDEVWANGFCQGTPLKALCMAFSGSETQRRLMSDHYVDLDRLRKEGRSYESALGSKSRKHLRQSYRDYGEMQVNISATRDSARDALHQLILLHTKKWNQTDQPGAFASTVFRSFHDALIARSFDGGHIQVIRVDAASEPIGILYNMVYGGDVYFYQSGLCYNDDKRLRPGVVSIAQAIHYCLERPDLRSFHFMAGGDHYKASMGTDQQQLEWVVFRKRSWKNAAIEVLRRARRKMRSVRVARSII